MKRGGSENAKRLAAEHAASTVDDGMVVGLGTGSTTAYAIRKLGQRVDDGLDIQGIPTSFQSRELAREVGIPLTTLETTTPDLAIDGADQVADGALIKGGGAAHAREKLVGAAADHLSIVIDDGKLAGQLDVPVPVEVVSDARTTVADRIRTLGGTPELRTAERKDGPVVTDNGNLVLDCTFETIDEPDVLATELSTIPGVLEHGLFVSLADEIHIGDENGVTVQQFDGA